MAASTETIRMFGYFIQPYEQYSDLYAIMDTEVHQYDFSADAFKSTSIYKFNGGNLPYSGVSWYDKFYVSKRGAGLVRLKGNSAVRIPGAPGGRYMIVANSHLMLANLFSRSSAAPNQLQWSDLYAPESFEISDASEADFFSLEPGDGEITGLTAQRSGQNIYTPNSIWQGIYNNGEFRFAVLYRGIGNAYHGGVIQVKDKDYFVDAEGFHELDGQQVQNIGDEIWKFFKATLKDNGPKTLLTAIVNIFTYEVAWIYDHVEGFRWSVVYNYKEDKWSDRDPQDVYCALFTTFALRGYIVIDDVPDIIDTMSVTIDGDWQFPGASPIEMYGSTNGRVLIPSGFHERPDGSAFACEAESYEFYLDSLFNVKEFDKLKLFYSGSGQPNLQLLVGTRNHRFEPVKWSPIQQIAEQLPGETAFYFRKEGVGKLVRFKFVWNNTKTDYISELTNIGFSKLDNADDTPEK